MDSNFQVKISVDLSQLQGRLKEVDAALKSLGFTADESNKKLTKSFEQTAVAAQKVSADMSRVRLATFAFGQVIRDAGFFSQNFGLGMLAISNNIPILIDQLVLLSGVSAGLGSVLSVLGSVLAAGLTVFAYWAQGVERDGGTVSGAINKMANDSQTSIGSLVSYLSQPPASEILGTIVNGVNQGMESIIAIIDAGIKLAIALWEKFGPTVLVALDKFFALAKNVMLISLNILRFAAAVVQGDWTNALKSIGNIGKLVFNNLIELAQSYIGFITKGIGTVVSLYDPLKGAMLEAAGQQVVKLGDSFKFATEGVEGFNFDMLGFINNLTKGDKQIKTTKDSLDKLGQSRDKISEKLYGRMSTESLPGLVTPRLKDQVKPKELFPSNLFDYQKEQLKNFVLAMEQTKLQVDDIFRNGIVATIGNSMMAIGEALATGGNVGRAFGKAILGSLSSVLSQFADMLIAAGLAGLTFSTALQNLFNPASWGIALAAGIGLKIAAGAIGGFARNPSGGGAAMPPTQSTGPNFLALPTAFQNGTMSMAGNNQMTLQTRISGNDLAILVNRADKNRNGYY